MLVITFALVVPAAQADSRGAAEKFRPALGSIEGARLSVGRAPASAKKRWCPSAKRALKFYAGRVAYWRDKRGAVKSVNRLPAFRGCPRYLANVYQRRAAIERKTYYLWMAVQKKKRERELRGTLLLLERGLRGTPMAGTSKTLEKWGRRFGVSPYFMVAVAATESSIGHAACSNNRYNVWGLASCNSSWYVPPFRSWDEAIRFYANFLAKRWPGHSTPYSFAGYAACDACWGRKVSEWMGHLFGVPAVTRYP